MSELSLGDQLRAAREARKLTLEQVSEEIRIRPKYLKALEEENFENLPDIVTAKGFLRNYAGFLGLDVNEVLSTFKALTTPAEETEIHIGTDEELFGKGPVNVRLRDSFGRRSQAASVLIVLAALLAIGGWWLIHTGRISTPNLKVIKPPSIHLKPVALFSHPTPTATEVPATPVPTAMPPTATNTPRPTATPSPTNTPTATPHPPIVLELDVVGERSWVQVVADGETKQASTLPPDTHASWSAQNTMELIVGNAGNVNLKVDDKSYTPLGEPGQVVHLVWSWQDGEMVEATPTPMPPTSTPSTNSTVTSTVTVTTTVTATPSQ
jgi:cytoskeleton protein RodZ